MLTHAHANGQGAAKNRGVLTRPVQRYGDFFTGFPTGGLLLPRPLLPVNRSLADCDANGAFPPPRRTANAQFNFNTATNWPQRIQRHKHFVTHMQG